MKPVPDHTPAFFEPGKMYVRDKSARISEVLRIFRCVAVVDHPTNGQPQAFGFVAFAHLSDDWRGAVWTLAHWNQGWVESDESESGPRVLPYSDTSGGV